MTLNLERFTHIHMHIHAVNFLLIYNNLDNQNKHNTFLNCIYGQSYF
jgi:hypothetical protein